MRTFIRHLVVIVMMAFVGSAGTWMTTRHGAGLSPDSVVYVAAARNTLCQEPVVSASRLPNGTSNAAMPLPQYRMP